MAADRSGTTTGGDVPNVAPRPVNFTGTTTPRGTGEPLTVDTNALRAAAERYGVQAGVFHAVAEAFRFLHDSPPIKRTYADAMEDETAEKFLPGYLRVGNMFLTGLDSIGTALDNIRDSIVLLAEGHEKTEDNNVQIARGALFSPGRSGTGSDVPREAVVPATIPDQDAITTPTPGPQRKGVVPDRGSAGSRDWSNMTIPLVPQELVNARGEKIGVLAPLGADVPDGGGRLILTGGDGQPKGFFQPYGEHTLDEALRGERRPGVLLPFAPSEEQPPVDPEAFAEPVSFPASEGMPARPREYGLWESAVDPEEVTEPVFFPASEGMPARPPEYGIGEDLPVADSPAFEGVPATPPESGSWEPAKDPEAFAEPVSFPASEGVPAFRTGDSDS